MYQHEVEYTLQGSWGARSEPVERIAQRVYDSFQVLTSLGAPLAGPWYRNYTTPIDITDLDTIRSFIIDSPATDDYQKPLPDEYRPRFFVGQWSGTIADMPENGRFSVSMHQANVAVSEIGAWLKGLG